MLFTRIILILLLISIIPISLLMEPSFFWENYPVEMGQNIVLALATLVALYWTIVAQKDKGIWFTGAILFFIAMLRELSWGRVFFVKGMDVDGPIIAEKAELWFGPYINILVVFLLILLVVSIWFNRQAIVNLVKQIVGDQESIFYACLMVILLAAASLLFDRDAIQLISPWHQGFEEMSELTSYWAAFTLALRVHQLAQGK